MPKGKLGPNDGGYIHNSVVAACKSIKAAQELYSQGHYPHSNARLISEKHPMRLIMDELAKLDIEYAFYANKKPDSELFKTYEPPIEDQRRWDR